MLNAAALSRRYLIKVLFVVAAVFSAVPVRAQENWARLPLVPGSMEAAAVPAPSRSEADHCAALPEALALPDSSAYDALTIGCFQSLLAVPDYVSPLQAVPVPTGQLTGKEQAALDKYVDMYAYLVNAALRDGKDVSKYRKYIRTLNRALGKLPAYSGVTFRGSSYPPVAKEKLAPGAVFTDPAFLSTSRNLEIADGYTGANGYLSVILSKTGRQMIYGNAIADLGVEMEVLFPTDTRFRVIAVTGRPNGNTVVYLEELI